MDISAQNTFTTGVVKSAGQYVAFSLAGTFAATVVIQRRRIGASTEVWRDVDSFTAPTEQDAKSAGDFEWRAGIKTGGYTSGTAVVNVY